MATADQTPDADIIDHLARYMFAARSAPLPAEVARKAKHHILDTLAAMVSGAQLPPGRLAAEYVRGLGGAEEAQLASSPHLTNAVNAALANGMAAHADETDDSHAASGTHPGCAVVPAALAAAERTDRSGESLLRAAVLGYDLCCRVTRALGYRERLEEHGSSSHSVGGLFGAAAAASGATELTLAQLRHLISYTAQQTSGIPTWAADEEHIEKAFDFAGMPARNGVSAATMVEAGFTGVWDVLSGSRSFLRSFSLNPNPQELLDGLGSRYEVMATNIKKHCVGSPIQAAADAVMNIMERERISAPDVGAVVVTLPVTGARTVDDRRMPDINLQYIMAVMLLDGGLSFAAAHDTPRMGEAAVMGLRRRIELRGDNALATAESPRQAVVEITTLGGARLREHVVAVRGTAENPMTTLEVEEKAADLLAPILGASKTQRLIATVGELETLGSVRELRPLLRP